MPAPGDQHNSGLANPFEEAKPRISEYTAKEIATLQSRLEKQLGPEYISTRDGPSGKKVHYITAEKCIALANEVFGFNGWSSSIRDITIDFIDEHPQTLKVTLGLSVIVRVTLKDGAFHEDIGYGHIENCRGKAAAFEKAKKEGTTDALKRALRSFGNVLGNCMYDKNYVARVSKMKVTATKFNEAALHRHGDFVKREEVNAVGVNSEAVFETFDDLLEEFDETDFCVPEEDDSAEDSMVSATTSTTVVSGNNAGSSGDRSHGGANGKGGMQQPLRPQTRGGSVTNAHRPPQTPNQPYPRPAQTAANSNRPALNQQRPGQNPTTPAAHAPAPQANAAGGNAAAPAQQHNGALAEPVAFFSARAVRELPEASLQQPATGALPLPQGQQAFNPKAESPSIRKTPGIDHSSSKPVSRSGQHVLPASSQPEGAGAVSLSGPAVPAAAATTAGVPAGLNRPQAGPAGLGASAVPGSGPGRGSVVNPQFDHTRRIGAPGGVGSPLANRGSYRPPTMKRPLPVDAAGGGNGRPALAEVTANTAVNAAGANGPGQDPKRQKMA